jgi:integrase
VSSRGRTYKRCGCTDPATGKQLGSRCPDLSKRHHAPDGWTYAKWIDTSQGRRELKRGGFARESDAGDVLGQVCDLIKLAGEDAGARVALGDFIWDRTKRGGKLPSVEDVGRRFALGQDLASPEEMFGQAWRAWLAGKRKARPSWLRNLSLIGQHWLLPVLEDMPLARIGGEQCAAVFKRIEDFNEEIRRAAEDGRGPVLPGDARTQAKHVGIAQQHRVYAALRAFMNFQVRRRHVFPFNPVFMVELEPEERDEARRWSAAEARQFLSATAADPLGLMLRIVLLRGARRGEAIGFRWAGANLDAGYLTVDRPVLQVGGTLSEGKPKTRAGARRIWLDPVTVTLLRQHRKAHLADRLRASTAWLDNDLIFCQADGSPWNPDYVTHKFPKLARAAGVPVIKLHEARHSAASLARDAGVDPEIRRVGLGHADQAMTSHYTHIEAAAHLAAAEAVARLVEGAGA